MKSIISTFRFLGIIFTLVGAPFFATAVIFIALAGNSYVFLPLAISFGTIGVTFLILGISFYQYAKQKAIKRDQLRREGICYEAEIVRIVPRPYVRINGYGTAHAECSYTNHEGKKCLVKSDSFLLYYSAENLKANIYVSRNDPKDYFVEFLPKTETDEKFDYDYR